MEKSSFIYQFMKKAEHPPATWGWRVANHIFCGVSIAYGALVYRRMRKAYPGKTLVVASLMSLGDLLFLRLGLQDLLNKAEIKDYRILMNQRCQKKAEMLGYENATFLSVGEMGALNVYIHFLHDRIPDVIDAYPWCLFDLQYTSGDLKLQWPEFPFDEPAMKQEFLRVGLRPGKTVMLSPYEQSLTANGYQLLPRSFWEQLAQRLKQRGYDVFTNCSGTEAEPPISGTPFLFPPVSQMSHCAAYAGGMVAIRSGLVDFCCAAKATKVVLYPDDVFFHTNAMGLSTDVVEISYEHAQEDGLETVMEEVLNAFPTVR